MLRSTHFTRSIGRSVEGREQIVHANFDLITSEPRLGSTLLIGAMHGDEFATVLLLEDFIARHLDTMTEPVVVLPLCNPDGYERCSRYNARGVDLNRNCGYNWRADSVEPPGPAPWSEPEICALRDFIVRWQPSKIVSLHWALAEIDADGAQSRPLAEALWAALDVTERQPYRLRVTEETRLETSCPGSLGQWCGYGVQYPDETRPAIITLELPYDSDLKSRPDELPEDHLDTLRQRWEQESDVYLRAIEGTVFKILLAACRFDR